MRRREVQLESSYMNRELPDLTPSPDGSCLHFIYLVDRQQSKVKSAYVSQ